MNKKKHIIAATGILLILICSVKLYQTFGYKIADTTMIMKVVEEITIHYEFYQVIATMMLFILGLVVTIPFFNKLGQGWCYILAMPIANAVWGILSASLLFVNIPYNRYTMATGMIIILIGVLIVFKDEYKNISLSCIVEVLCVVFLITILATIGIFPIFMSSDSYYFIMQYGELITKFSRLSSDYVGTYMTWTGITPALTSSFASMWGFENIYAIHYLLIFSMYGCIGASVYCYAVKSYSKIKAGIFAIAAILTTAVVPGISYMSIWIISNTYFMVYIVFVIMLLAVFREKINRRIIGVISLFCIWLALSRPEGALIMCFYIICMSYLKLTRKQVLALYLPICIMQLLFFGKLVYEYMIGAKQAKNVMLTQEVAAILILALILTAGYIVLYNKKWVEYIRKHMTIIVLVGLCVASLGLGLLEVDKLSNNILVIAKNFASWWWNYVPLMIIVVEIVKCCLKCRNKFFDLVVIGFVLCNFAICLGRPHGLRMGIGDSYNRMCLSILPLYVVTTICSFMEGSCKQSKKN